MQTFRELCELVCRTNVRVKSERACRDLPIPGSPPSSAGCLALGGKPSHGSAANRQPRPTPVSACVCDTEENDGEGEPFQFVQADVVGLEATGHQVLEGGADNAFIGCGLGQYGDDF